MDSDEEGRRAYEKERERRRPARRVVVTNIDMPFWKMVVGLIIAGILLGFGSTFGRMLASYIVNAMR